MADLTPIFLISLPRSGSTLLQKMLAVSPEVATTAEPWICLPLATMLDRTAVAAEYGHDICAQAIEDLAAELPGGEAEFRNLAAEFVMSIYRRIAEKSGARLFLDKTPRYYFIVPFLAEAFPEAKFVFLYRHPLEVFSSILKTWHRDRISYRLLGNYVDLMRGPHLMAAGARLLGERALCLDYARLVEAPNAVMPELCDYLGIPFSVNMLSDYREVEMAGRMGDPTGVKSYDNVSRDSLAKWKQGISNVYRKWYAKRYVRYLGNETLQAFGLSVAQLLSEIDNIPTTMHGALRDAVGHGHMSMWRLLNYLSVGLDKHSRKRARPYLPYG